MATFTVTSLSDVTDATDGVLTLREAAALANTTAGADTIDFDTGTGGSIENGGLIRLTQGEIEITDAVTINGASLVTVTGDALGNDALQSGTDVTDIQTSTDALLVDNSRIFSITDSSATTVLDGLTLTGGNFGTTSSDPYGSNNSTGGAISSAADLFVSSSTLEGNRAAADNNDALGGAIYAEQTLTLDTVSLVGNLTQGYYGSSGGGAFALGTLTITDSDVLDNETGGRYGGDGGGLFAGADLTVENSLFAENSSRGDGGAVRVIGALSVSNSRFTANETTGRYSSGGAISVYGGATISDSDFNGNFAYVTGGALHANIGLQINNSVFDANATTIDGGGAIHVRSRGFTNDPTATTLISNTVFQNNSTEGSFAQGGAVFASAPDLLLIGTSFIDNVLTGGEAGGGALALGTYGARLYNSTFTGNSTAGFAGNGGAIYTAGTISLTNTTLAANTTAGGDGGALFARDDVTLAYATLTGNSTAGSFGVGGAIAVLTTNDPTLTITNSILAGNYSQRAGAAEDINTLSFAGGSLTVVTQGAPSFFGSAEQDAAALFAVPVETLIDADGDGIAETGTGVFGGAAADNGGPVQTVAIRPGGPAVDAISLPNAIVTDVIDLDGDGDTTEDLPVDARGFARSVGVRSDVGAFEDQTNQILGTGNDDILTGTDGVDNIIGLDGDDTLNGRAGNDTLDGGLGNDRFFVDSVDDVVIEAAGEGTDLITTAVDFTLPEHVENASSSGSADIEITGNAGANFMSGNGGDNRLVGLAGADRLRGGAGNDTLEGGEGNDILEGQDGVDRFVMSANNGDDQIIGWEASTDILDFEALGLRFADLRLTSSGNEALITFDDPAGGTGSVRLIDIDPELLEIGIVSDPGGIGSPGGINLLAGTSGSENLAGTAAGEDLIGLAGNDTLNGRAGDDTMLGGFGDDRYLLDDAGDIALELEFQGIDQVDTRFDLVLGANIERAAVRGGGAVDITGNELDNFITGSDLQNVLIGGDGRDRLIARAGNDTLDGGLDRDVLEGGAGEDVFVFGADSDVDLITDFVVGEDLIDVSALGIAFADMTIVDGPLGALVIFDLEPGSVDLVTLQGVSAADVRLASFIGAPNLPIVGTENDDVLRGTVEDDVLLGLGGADQVDGQAGADTLIGGDGDDRYFVDDAVDVVIEFAGEGTDLVSSLVDFTLPEHVENGSALGTGNVDLTGNAVANALTGNDASNVLIGLEGDDNLQGKAGADTIDGGAGFDVLRGGADADVFVFAPGDGATGDQIIDFEVGVDVIDLSATGLGFGDLTIVDVGANANVTYGMNTLTVFNTTAAELDQDQFGF